MSKEKSKILPNKNFVSLISVGGIKAIISTKGIIDTNKMIPDTTKRKIEKSISCGLENILDNWLVEGEFKNDTFYVKYIRDDSGKILDIYETKEWANIMGFPTSISEKKEKFKDIRKSGETRPESSFSAFDYGSMTTGRSGWRKRVIEEMRNGIG